MYNLISAINLYKHGIDSPNHLTKNGCGHVDRALLIFMLVVIRS